MGAPAWRLAQLRQDVLRLLPEGPLPPAPKDEKQQGQKKDMEEKETKDMEKKEEENREEVVAAGEGKEDKEADSVQPADTPVGLLGGSVLP